MKQKQTKEIQHSKNYNGLSVAKVDLKKAEVQKLHDSSKLF